MLSAETMEVMERIKETMTTYIPATNRGSKVGKQQNQPSRSDVTVRTPVEQKQKLYRNIVLDEGEVRVLEYLLRHCEGDVITQLKSKLAMLDFSVDAK